LLKFGLQVVRDLDSHVHRCSSSLVICTSGTSLGTAKSHN
jgi:hypothetical protein